MRVITRERINTYELTCGSGEEQVRVLIAYIKFQRQLVEIKPVGKVDFANLGAGYQWTTMGFYHYRIGGQIFQIEFNQSSEGAILSKVESIEKGYGQFPVSAGSCGIATYRYQRTS